LKQNPSAAGAIGYRETIDFIEGRLPALSPSNGPEGELAAAIARNTRALVKKQRTWFKTQLPAHPQVAAASATVDGLFAPPV
ncbi:MAG: tRNA (adenosine(37)-N6)-dimethylallyltransferase MiaA, partial [Oleiharenicola lentus]